MSYYGINLILEVLFLKVIVNKCKNIGYKTISFYIILILCIVTSIIFVQNNYSFYERPIAKVTKVNIVESNEQTDSQGNDDQLFTQQIIAEIMNGEAKGENIQLANQYSISGAYDHQYKVGNELFVSIDKHTNDASILTGDIKDVKRDKYIIVVAWVFMLTLLFVGKKQGLLSILSLVVNAGLLSFALDIYLKTAGTSLLWICSISVILFTVISLLLVNGFNEKTYTAIIATLLGTFVSLLLTYIVMWLTSDKGLRYEEMQFVTSPYRLVFLAGLFIGSLGAVMDVAITMSSSIFGLYEKNNEIPVQALKASGIEIGKDIMGTMTNILFFAYISGSIPMLILYLKNASPWGYTLSTNLSLELARALAGGFGIVLTIPIGLYISIFFINKRKRSSQ